MILANGVLYDSKEQDNILSHLEDEINRTRMSVSLDTEKVISAIDSLGRTFADGGFDAEISALDIDGIQNRVDEVISICSRESLEYRLKTELGYCSDTAKSIPSDRLRTLEERIMPLGTLFHIAAGNADGLPAMSVAEGLLTGNVNILKLPQADNGLSIKILQKLIENEPSAAPFIYVFDTPSTDISAMKRMASLADGIVVWGGDSAVSAVRQLAPVGCKLIEWGHKLSFAYISGYENKESELDALAEHIMSTKQLLCSSCQTIFIDTDSIDGLHSFCKEFLPRLEAAALRHTDESIGAVAQRTLSSYNSRLEDILSGKKASDSAYRGKSCCLTVCGDSSLELSEMFGSCLVKALPRERLFEELRKKKGYLQTAGLICSPESRSTLADILSRSGVTRIMHAGDMSASFCAEAHDGEYPLRRYTRIVNVQR